MKITYSVPLSEHTTFRIGGPAKFFVEATTAEDVREAVALSKESSLPFLILGEGSNVLASDAGFDGYIIRPKILGIDLQSNGLLVVGAGEHWDDVVAFVVARNFSGIENLSWIPGSVGAAPVQNIGAYGVEVGDVVEWVEVFDTNTGEFKKLLREECGFSYRNSIFKSPEGKNFVITRVALQLVEDGQPNISYKDVAAYFSGLSIAGQLPSVADVRDAVIHIRQRKLPDVTQIGTAGSFFKNPIITESKFSELSAQYPGLPSFSEKPGFRKIPLAWVLDKVCGLNGLREGNVGLFETQPLALVNFGNATADGVKNFAQKISDIVKNKTGIEIEWEVNHI